jgi:hypothetical protein
MNMTFLPAPRRAYVVGLVLLLAAVLATHLQPVPERYPDAAAIDLEAMIPSRFGTWQDDPSGQLAQLRYGLRGEIPDGLLVRVSSLSNDPDAAYHLQSQFLEALLANVDDATRARLLGSRKPILIGRSAG